MRNCSIKKLKFSTKNEPSGHCFFAYYHHFFNRFFFVIFFNKVAIFSLILQKKRKILRLGPTMIGITPTMSSCKESMTSSRTKIRIPSWAKRRSLWWGRLKWSKSEPKNPPLSTLRKSPKCCIDNPSTCWPSCSPSWEPLVIYL